jgi:flagellar hook-associated protein 2
VSTQDLTADLANTTDGSTAITSSTQWDEIYGASVQANDTITISGADHNGNAVSGSLTIDDANHTVQELLTAIQDTFGNVTASIVDGKIRVTDNTTGDSQLTVILTENNQAGGALDLGNITSTTANVGNKRNTTDGSTAIVSGTTWANVYGASVVASDTITIAGTDHNGNAVSGTLTIDDTGHTVQELLDAIESAYSNTVTASITSEGKILIVDDSSGTSYLSLTLTENNEGGGSLDFGVIEAVHGGSDREMVAGSDATLSVDGLQVTSTDNAVEDVIAGVTLNLLKADSDTTITLNIERDIDAIVDNMSAFVDAYNEVASYIYQQQSYDTENETNGGVLFGDGTLSSVKSDLTSTLLQSAWGVSSDFSTMGLVGINLDIEGQLSIDTDTLRGYLETNFNDIKALFAANGTTDTGTLEYIGYSRDTQPNEYTVHITNAAVRSNSTSNNGTVGENETLTITEGSKIARISLTTSMSRAQIVAAINTELDEVYTETLVGGNALQEGASAITSSTEWEDINGTTWGGADKVISFSGTTRSGQSVQGSYEDFDVSTDTVQGLLTEIEEAFSNEVTASIDTSGRIVLTDKYTGNSQLSLVITEPAGSNLDFGDVDVTVGAGDGSQEGRYAMSITASDDGSHVVLTHDNYGSDYSFTVSEDAALAANKLWTGGDQTVDNGEDVTGTIGGKDATGSGQKLIGADGDVEGLAIAYTGTDENQDVGKVTLTLGAAVVFDRVLFNITDTYDGYVGFKQDSLESSIDRLDDQIEKMEARLDRKLQRMINQFVHMEVALSTMQSQSAWLTGQINASYSVWGW